MDDCRDDFEGAWFRLGSGIPSGEAVCFSWTSFTEMTPGSPASFVAWGTRSEPTTSEMSPAFAYRPLRMNAAALAAALLFAVA